ncbi:hypothetical protein [Duganella sp. BuS-21]|uniref:hypothetical protein n=1 Tax=Duganella sp. BuS-21 TaxID=2943848 RepID=UPI0035A684A5
MRAPKSNICVLCGVRPATTRDHLPPKGWFKGLGAQLITVPACAECNEGASSDDVDLRFYISAQIGKQTDGSAALWDNGAHKTILKKAALRKSFLASARDVVVTDADGVDITRLAFVVPVRLYQKEFERIVRGLYFHHTTRILPQSAPVIVTLLTAADFENQDVRELHKHHIGGDACIYRFGVAEDQIDSSVWVFEFYSSHFVMVATGAASENEGV